MILKKLIKFLEKKNKKINLIIRPHPSEKKTKYKNFFSKKIKIVFDHKISLTDSIRKSTVICGHNSMAMVVGKICGLRSLNIKLNGVKETIPNKFIDENI